MTHGGRTWRVVGKGATVEQIAVFLGLNKAYVRKVINKHSIEPTGTLWNAKLYNTREVVEHLGAHDRLPPKDGVQ